MLEWFYIGTYIMRYLWILFRFICGYLLTLITTMHAYDFVWEWFLAILIHLRLFGMVIPHRDYEYMCFYLESNSLLWINLCVHNFIYIKWCLHIHFYCVLLLVMSRGFNKLGFFIVSLVVPHANYFTGIIDPYAFLNEEGPFQLMA